MDLVEHHQPILVRADETGHIVQAPPVLGQLEIQVNGVAARSDPPRERRLAGLAWPQQRHRRLPAECCFDLSGQASRDIIHVNSIIYILICMVIA